MAFRISNLITIIEATIIRYGDLEIGRIDDFGVIHIMDSRDFLVTSALINKDGPETQKFMEITPPCI